MVSPREPTRIRIVMPSLAGGNGFSGMEIYFRRNPVCRVCLYEDLSRVSEQISWETLERVVTHTF